MIGIGAMIVRTGIAGAEEIITLQVKIDMGAMAREVDLRVRDQAAEVL